MPPISERPPHGPRARLVDFLLWLARRLPRGSRLLASFAVGCCDPDDLRRRCLLFWGRHEELLSAEHFQRGLMPWEEVAYAGLVRPRRIALIGCGTGREAAALHERGCRVDGVDASRVAIETARGHLEAIDAAVDLRCTAVEEWTPPHDEYDAVVFCWFTYCYLLGSARRIAVLRRLRRHLASDGEILVSYPRRFGLAPVSVRIARLGALSTFSGMRPEATDLLSVCGPPNQGGVVMVAEIDQARIADEASEAGLRVTETLRFDDDDLTAVARLHRRR